MSGKCKSDMSGSEQQPFKKSYESVKPKIELSTHQKMIVIQKLMPHARHLFEKFNLSLNKDESKKLWDDIRLKLKEEGILFDNWFRLKENVRNWYGRAIKKNDALKKTGASGGSSKQLNEFEEECLAFVRACKGDHYVDLIECVESTGNEINPQSAETDANDIIISLEEMQPGTSNNTPIQAVRRKKISDNANSQWKEKYFNQIEDIERMRLESEAKDSEMHRYSMFLRCTELEQKLNLSEDVTRSIRKAVSEKKSITEMPVILTVDTQGSDKINEVSELLDESE